MYMTHLVLALLVNMSISDLRFELTLFFKLFLNFYQIDKTYLGLVL